MLTKCDKDLGKDITIQIMNKGEIFGDTEVLEDGCRPATVTTCLEVMFWSVDAEVGIHILISFKLVLYQQCLTS